MERGLTERLSEAIVKARRGEPLTPEDRAAIQEGMKGVAPSSREFQALSEALAAAGPVYTPGQGDIRSQVAAQTYTADNPASLPPATNTPNLRQPTLDWAAGLGRVRDAVVDEFSDPFGGTPEARPSYRPSPAAASDTQGSAPIGSDTHVSETGAIDPPDYDEWSDPNAGIPGPQLAAGHGIPYNVGEDDVADVSAVNFPEGYSFSNGNETSVDMFKYNPELFNRKLTEDVLGQRGMEPYWENKTRAAMQMAAYGLLGNGSGRDDLGGGPTTSTGSLAATEDFMKQFAAPGVQTVDPGQIYDQIMARTLNTDWSTQIGRTGEVMGPEEMIETTNNALLTAMGFSNPETEAWMTSILENAKMEYMMYLAEGGDTTVSYPKWLDENGYGDLL